MSPKFAFFDSNTWIYLANGFDAFANKYGDLHFRVFDLLEKRVKDGSLVIFTNEIIKEEWGRHLDDAAHQIKVINADAKAFKGHLIKIGAFTGKNQTEIAEINKAIEEALANKIALHEQHIDKVKKFIEDHTDVIDVTDSHRVEASQMAQRKQAPFKGDKSNSMSDALIVLSITDFLDKSKKCEHAAVQYALQEDGVVESYFVTSNFSDFADPADKHQINPDLAPILGRSGTEYYPTLGLLINKLEKEFLTQDELRAMEEADIAIHCNICDSEYPSVQFSSVPRVFDPFKLDGSNDANQLAIFEDLAPIYQEPYSDVETAYCNHCGADFITCPNCSDLVHIKENERTPCTSCHYKFELHVDRDRKGAIHGYDYLIIKDYSCNDCGDNFDEVDEDGLCETYAEFQRTAETN